MSSPAQAAPPDCIPSRPSWATRVFRTPLLTKLVLLDMLINVIALIVLRHTPAVWVDEVTVLSLGLVLVLNAALVAWALRPLQVLEDTARRVSTGEFTARTRMPPLADRNLVRIGDTLDALLERVALERERVRTLAAQVVAAGDRERAHIARELHDGTAQSLAAIEMLLSSTIGENPDSAVSERLRLMRDIANEALAEVRALSHAVHPRVLDDLGLQAALEQLTRRLREQQVFEITLSLECSDDRALAMPVASVLYRVAQEALHNALKHANARRVEVSLTDEHGRLELLVSDDGVGFDRAAVEAERRGMGLFVMQERVALTDGTLSVRTAPGRGTEIRVTIPKESAWA